MNRQDSDRSGTVNYVDYRTTRCRCGSPIRPHEPVCTVCGRRQNLLVEGLEKVDPGDIDMTIARLSKEVEGHPYDYIKLFRLANTFLLKGRYEPARDFYRRLLEKKPDFSPARLNLGVVLAYLADTKGAIEQLEEYVRLDIHSPKVERVVRAICSLKGVPYEDVLRETRSKQAIALRSPGTTKGISGGATFSSRKLRSTVYQPIVKRKSSWGAIDVFLGFLVLIVLAGWFFFPAQSIELAGRAVAGLESPFSFRIENGRVSGSEAPEADGETQPETGGTTSTEDSATASADEEDEQEQVVNANPSTSSYLPLATDNNWEYAYYDTGDPYASRVRKQNQATRHWRVTGLVKTDPDIWGVDISVDTVYYIERTDGLYSVTDTDTPWATAICQIPLPPTDGKSMSNGWQEVTVEGVEQVETPAGTFDCIKLHYTVPEPPGTEWFAWYAQGVGLVKYIGGGRMGALYHVLELRSYEIQ